MKQPDLETISLQSAIGTQLLAGNKPIEFLPNCWIFSMVGFLRLMMMEERNEFLGANKNF